jgi:hypothetical protein
VKILSQWLTPVIPATQEAEIRRIKVRSQPGQIVPQSPISKKKKKSQKKAGGVAQGVGLEFKPQHYKKKRNTAARNSGWVRQSWEVKE